MRMTPNLRPAMRTCSGRQGPQVQIASLNHLLLSSKVCSTCISRVCVILVPDSRKSTTEFHSRLCHGSTGHGSLFTGLQHAGLQHNTTKHTPATPPRTAANDGVIATAAVTRESTLAMLSRGLILLVVFIQLEDLLEVEPGLKLTISRFVC
jgi:hypothetical protein